MSNGAGRILYVDDDITLDGSDPYIEHLSMCNYFVQVVISPEEFWENLNSEKWDVIILDIMFPRGNNYSIADSKDGRRTGVLILQEILKLGDDANNYKIPVIIRTAVINNLELKKECLDLGMEDKFYFEKPGNLLQFTNAINEAVGSYKTYRQKKVQTE